MDIDDLTTVPLVRAVCAVLPPITPQSPVHTLVIITLQLIIVTHRWNTHTHTHINSPKCILRSHCPSVILSLTAVLLVLQEAAVRKTVADHRVLDAGFI